MLQSPFMPKCRSINNNSNNNINTNNNIVTCMNNNNLSNNKDDDEDRTKEGFMEDRIEASEYSQQHRRQKRLIWWNSDPSKSQQGVPQAVAAST